MAGPLTYDDLEVLWSGITDSLYSQSLQQSPDGYAAIQQGIAQYTFLAECVNTSAQALFLLPWSGQTSPPASGAARAEVDLVLRRTSAFTRAVVIDPVVRVEEVAIDFSKAGPVDVRTGRRYVPSTRLTFAPGEAGPSTVHARAERLGSGYNHPLGAFTGADGTQYPGALRGFYEPGAGHTNEKASVEPASTGHRLRCLNAPDVPLPEHVGSQLEILAGANAGQLRRVVGYLAPEGDDGGSFVLATTAVLAVDSVSGTFEDGEEVTQASGSSGVLLRLAGGRMVIDGTSLVEFDLATITGTTSGATATVMIIEQPALMTAEVSAASWRIVSLVELGFASSNPLKPSGGADSVLDLLGDERDVHRLPDEPDDDYRYRIAQPSDAVSPMALVRAMHRSLAPYGVDGAIREVGTDAFPGAFYDGDDCYDRGLFAVSGVAVGVFEDGELIYQDAEEGPVAVGRAQVRSPVVMGALPQALSAPVLVGVEPSGTVPFVSGALLRGQRSGAKIANPIVTDGPRSEDRWRVQLDYAEFRAFFLVDAPLEGLGEFGAAYDAGSFNAYDAAPFHTFYDGIPLTSAVARRAVWQAISAVKAGGVGFDLVR